MSAAAVGVTLPWTADACRAKARDRDADGVDDDCELALAQAFAPELIVDPSDCLWDNGVRPSRLGGGYLFAAESTPDDRGIRIAYLPAYYRDCGWQGVACATRGRRCSAHDGDSEVVVVEARYDHAIARWITEAVFLSAHCFGRSNGRCRWYEGDMLPRLAWAGGILRAAPRVWVAKGKHGNYPSRAACDTGHWYYDSCDANSVAYRFPISSNAQNIGSRRRPLPESDGRIPAGCIAADRLLWRASAVDGRAHECFWNPGAPFRGWQSTALGPAPTPYARVLEYAAQF
ncbi:MAG: hypothetical protein ABR499_05995 [Gemmatimonadaceae bacterium]